MQLVIDTSIILAVLISEPERDQNHCLDPRRRSTCSAVSALGSWECVVRNDQETKDRLQYRQWKALDAYEKFQ